LRRYFYDIVFDGELLPYHRYLACFVLIVVLFAAFLGLDESSTLGETNVNSSCLYLNIVDDRTVDVAAVIRLSNTSCYSHLVVLLPFLLDADPSPCVTPMNAIHAIGNIQQVATLVAVWMPYESSELEVRGTTHHLIEVYDTDWLKIVLDFNYPNLDQIKELQRISQNSSWLFVVKFDEVKVQFPYGSETWRVDDNPEPFRSNAYKEYTFEDISKAGGRLTIRFPARATIFKEFFEIALALIPGVLAILVREELRRRPSIVDAGSIITWALFAIAMYLYVSNLLRDFRYLSIFLAYSMILTYMGFSRWTRHLRKIH